MREYYLNVLGLHGNPSQKEIKSAYRRLSKKFHPDLNPSEDAVEKFIQIDKAYDYLTTVTREPIIRESPEVRDPREEWKKRVRRKTWEEAQERKRLIKSILRPFDYLFYAILTFNALLIVDLLIPKMSVEQDLVKLVIGRDRPHQVFVEINAYDDLYFSDYYMRVDRELLSWADPGNQFSLEVSRIFHVPVKVSVANGNNRWVVSPAVGPYHFWIFLIPLLVITWLIYRFAGLTDDNKLTLAIFVIIPAILQLNVFLRYT